MGEAVNTVAKGVMGALDPLGIAGQASKAMGATPLGGLMGDAMEDPEKVLMGPSKEIYKTAKKDKNVGTLLTGGLNRY